MPVEFTASADKHRIPREDAIHAMLHAEGSEGLPSRNGYPTTMYVGRPHPQTDRRLEVGAWMKPPNTVTIFHVMDVSDLFRHLIQED